MTDARVGERERSANEWYGAPQEGQVPARAETGGGAGARTSETALARWMRRVKRVLRDAAIGAAIIASVPLGLTFLPWQWSPLARPTMANTIDKVRLAERARPLAAAKDPSIDPLQAGFALATLQPEVRSAAFVFLPVPHRLERPWASAAMPRDLFPAAGSASSWNGPSNQTILKVVAKGVNARELAYLRMIAEAPVWPAFDLAARAPSVDVLGGRFQVPFPDRARADELPLWRFAATKELAYASVSRAAYYLAIGNRAEADAVLRRTIGFGFIFIDNATTVIDALIGKVMVDIGRAGLEDLYAATGDPRLANAQAAKDPGNLKPYQGRSVATGRELREFRLFNAVDHTLPRAVRLENLHMLARTVCTNPREMVFGPAADVRDAFARAARELARFPAERALLDLMLTDPSRPLPPLPSPYSMPSRLVFGTATIASLIFDNPRMSYCTRVLVGPWSY